MIKLESNETLYLVLNEGCDDTTSGIVIINDNDFPKFKEFVENLNKNSTYVCMPTIVVYKIDPGILRESKEGDAEDHFLYLNGKTYVSVSGQHYSLYREGELVISND